jgi:hypothetical protein
LPACGRVNNLAPTAAEAGMSEDVPIFSAQDALIAVMVAVSVSDESIRTSELVTIEGHRRSSSRFLGL